MVAVLQLTLGKFFEPNISNVDEMKLVVFCLSLAAKA
jgi:hypothetical protein